MSIDIYHTRKGNYRRCVYWIRDIKSNIPIEQYVLQNNPKGIFYAKESSEITIDQKQLNNVIMLDKNSVLLETEDDVEGIDRGSVVKYLGSYWYVESVSFEVHIKETEFSSHLHGKTYLNIRQ